MDRMKERSWPARSGWRTASRCRDCHDKAVAQFERVIALANDVGLLSEEYDVPAKHLAGNFPQALTHLALVNTALGLSGPVLNRAGG